jgi:ABC-type sugar transport system ATPase subunit
MLEAVGLNKAYGGVTALHDGTIALKEGRVHALLGENGAGKSTLVKILVGAVPPDAGEIRLDGTLVHFASTADAADRGVAVVSQELNLFPDLDVLANLFPMRQPRRGPLIQRRRMAERAAPVLDELGLHVDPKALVGSLSLADRQLLEVARALVADPKVLILDEPTSALEATSSDVLLRAIEALRARQVAVLFVSHILDEVMQICDDITILRDGRAALSAVPRSELTVRDIVGAMLGPQRRERSTIQMEAPPRRPGEARRALEVDRVSVPGLLEPTTLRVEQGEIVGLAGLRSSGNLPLIECIAGLRRPGAGTVTLPSGVKNPKNLRAAIGAGLALVTGERRKTGLLLDKPVWENVGLVQDIGLAARGPWVARADLRARARHRAEQLHIRLRDVDQSGGNQQKVVFSMWLETDPSLLVLVDPTRGVDVGAKAEMHELIRALATAGSAVLLYSTDLEEMASLSDRIAVFHRGRCALEAPAGEMDQHRLLEAVNTGEVSDAA